MVALNVWLDRPELEAGQIPGMWDFVKTKVAYYQLDTNCDIKQILFYKLRSVNTLCKRELGMEMDSWSNRTHRFLNSQACVEDSLLKPVWECLRGPF